MFDLPPEVEELRDAITRFAQRELAPHARDNEAAGRLRDVDVEVIDGFSLSTLDLPSELGGSASALAKVVALEALAYGDAGALPAVDRPGIASGAIVACPDRDVASELMDACTLVVADDSTADASRADTSRTTGPLMLEWAPSWPELRGVFVIDGDTLSLHDIGALDPVTALAFAASGGAGGSIAADPSHRWELERGAGLAVRGRARLWTSAVAIGVAQAAFDATVEYTTDRIVFGKAVAHHQANAFELAAAVTNIHGARLAVQDAARRFDADDPYAGYWATQAWFTTTDAALAVVDQGIQLLGGHGFLVDHLAEKRFREVGMLRLMTGGRDAALSDVAGDVLDTPDPLYA